MEFEQFFLAGSVGRSCYPFQARLAEAHWPETLVVPTGFGKTAAILAAWLWKTARKDPATPRRLVYCLPMRTLVEQTESTAKKWIAVAKTVLDLEVHLDILMGGRGEERRGIPSWMMKPDQPAILIGTQDLLVSSALMRGYSTSRYRWPVDFALLHNDALWIFDEVQLTGAAMATSAQLQGFRQALGTGRPCRTLWMSATLDPAWLQTVDFSPSDSRRAHDLSADDLGRARHLWVARKQLQQLDLPTAGLEKKDGVKSYATSVAEAASGRSRPGSNTILFLNTVARAQAVFDALKTLDGAQELVLVHSRFRAADRANRMVELLTEPPEAGRIVVATQALEAGVDVTSSVMITEIAPWSSLVQRFGRCNRDGKCTTGAEIFWIDLTDAAARPYESTELAEARKKLETLIACGPADLANIEPSAPPRGHVIRKRDLLDLFDTDPDLSGFDVDVSIYVRDVDDTDVRLFWRPVDGGSPADDAPGPARDELCPAPIQGGKELVKRADNRAWRWDALTRKWRRIGDREVFPGLTIWIDANVGGYDANKGFDPSSKRTVPAILSGTDRERSMEDEPDTITNTVKVGLAKHSAHVRDQAQMLADNLGITGADRDLIAEAGLWHDLGKAHPAFVLRMGKVEPPLAKSPSFESRPKGDPSETRPYFRHELASALAYLANREWRQGANLAAYLIAAHHGKVRMRIRGFSHEARPASGRLFARGVWDGDRLPETRLGDHVVPETTLDLDLMQLGDGRCGPSWSARTQRLLTDIGPFRLAWLEAMVRIADWRASEAEEKAGHDDL